ncbi:MAG: hypothetical protein KatS3mg081_2592 [Gemmatimonadales bacterium]|nr:MAG: hypothetical protein KatS3mg081_2592 [Gemmatimonadales bacterium]
MLREAGPGCRFGWIYREVLPGVITEIAALASLTIFHVQALLVYVDGELVGKTARSMRASAGVWVDALADLKELRELQVRAGPRKIELRNPSGAVVVDTTLTLHPGEVRVVDFSGRRGGY